MPLIFSLPRLRLSVKPRGLSTGDYTRGVVKNVTRFFLRKSVWFGFLRE